MWSKERKKEGEMYEEGGGWSGRLWVSWDYLSNNNSMFVCACVSETEWGSVSGGRGCFRLQKWWNNISSPQHSWCCHADSHASWPLRHSLGHCLSQELTFATKYTVKQDVCYEDVQHSPTVSCLLFRKSFKGPLECRGFGFARIFSPEANC